MARLSAIRIASFTLLLLGAALLAFALTHQKTELPQEFKVQLPPMDARLLAVRENMDSLLANPMHREGDALAATCGLEAVQEAYRLTEIPGMVPNPELRSLTLLVTGNTGQFRFKARGMLETSSPISIKTAYANSRQILAFRQAIASSGVLSISPREETACFDGGTLYFEACVDGRYFGLALHCPHDERLWELQGRLYEIAGKNVD